MNIEIRRNRPDDAASLSEAVTSVAREKWYLATIDGFTPNETRDYIDKTLHGGLHQVVAVTQGMVIGACDVRLMEAKGFAHVGQLGMFVCKQWRGQGIGRKLLAACLPLAARANIERIELEVFADNIPAIRLYESSGFRSEGVKVHGRKWEGRYQDVVLMALLL
jgi:RimJ/RimL family protein N-acetyltransferase